jgi:hypothetical protein
MSLHKWICLLGCFFLARLAWPATDEDFVSLTNEAKKLLQNAREGTENGQFEPGSKTAFQLSLDSARMLVANSLSTAQTDSLINQLHLAYLRFLKKRHGIQRPLIADNYWEIANTPSRWGSYNLHDPTVIQTKGYFYVYGTDAAWGQSIKGIPYRRSRDLVHWEYLGTAFNGTLSD